MKLLFLGLGMQEVIIIAIVVLLLFGGKKIPELMRGMGKGVRNFKEGMNGTDEKTDETNKPTNNNNADATSSK